MNLHGIVRGAIRTVNPDIKASIQRSNGYTTAADGTNTPAYDAPCYGVVQVQPLSTGDVIRTNGLNIQGVTRSVYLRGNMNGIVRADKVGGDMMTFSVAGVSGNRWRVVDVAEAWPDWTRVIVCLQA